MKTAVPKATAAPRSRLFLWIREYMRAIGRIEGNIIAAIITTQTPTNQPRSPRSVPGPASIPSMRSPVMFQARIESAISRPIRPSWTARGRFARPRGVPVPAAADARPDALGVLVMAANPGLEGLPLIASLRRPVEDGVVAHHELDPAERGPIRLVGGVVLEGESAHRWYFRDVSGDVRTARGRVLGRDRRQVALARRHELAYLLLCQRGAHVEAEVGVHRRDPGDAPTHPLLVGLKLVERSAGNEQKSDVAGVEVRQQAVEAVDHG